MTPRLVEWMDRRFYPETDRNWDTLRYRSYLLERMRPTDTLLELGAGRGALDEMDFRGRVGLVVGADVDPVVLKNPFLDAAEILLPGKPYPFPASSFDVVFSNSVMEHVSDPSVVFSEIARLLKPNGLFISKTPNRNHYVSAIARFTPHSFHTYINSIRGRPVHDTFETLYRCNDEKTVRRLAQGAGLEVDDICYWESRPEYLRINALTYWPGLAYERLVNSTTRLEEFRAVLVFALRKSAM